MSSRFRHPLTTLALCFGFAAFAGTVLAAQTDRPTTTESLRREILAMDARLSEAYEACKTRRFEHIFSRDAELIFGERGRLRGVAAHADDVRRGDCAMRRETDASAHRIEALPGHTGAIDGALQIGEQRFCAREPRTCDGMSTRFVAVWHRTETGWKIVRLIRYAYAPVR